ncbi:beta-ketoacyl synthase N-terminal-like domain-containing protein [Solitalea lacus]|uniref:beta-ketoacyl synthase N-terminal-like domain-containing protein n=1 Tax=Solitalea lacus TaxID=2911172 RepID=UPI001EDC8C36|nr:beta-ketoacyl synthase N-terminal-like domain-containing protein [Solitalea lacus]UKJ08962.1 beta-ketoacyl synthase [Solitalea lacus]
MDHIKIAIVGWGSISALGTNKQGIWENYLKSKHCFTHKDFPMGTEWVSVLEEESAELVAKISNENLKYQQLDPTAWFAIAASRIAWEQAGWQNGVEVGVNIGSSRGATVAFEKFHSQFLNSGFQNTDILSSPTTTLGNIASWVGVDLGVHGPHISHSITCSTALHAILNAVAWLKSGLSDKFLAGGSEVPLTPFTLAQMKALKVYSNSTDNYPCQSMNLNKKRNTMILGEGAAVFSLERNLDKALAYISGIGYGTEQIKHGASISDEAVCQQQAMRMAIKGHDPESIDAIVLHSPGTIKGDKSEMNAIKAVFGTYMPLLTSNKWKIGHTFGASGALSLEMALLMLQHNQFIQTPYLPYQEVGKPLRKILINAVGFGGNAVSILIESI